MFTSDLAELKEFFIKETENERIIEGVSNDYKIIRNWTINTVILQLDKARKLSSAIDSCVKATKQIMPIQLEKFYNQLSYSLTAALAYSLLVDNNKKFFVQTKVNSSIAKFNNDLISLTKNYSKNRLVLKADEKFPLFDYNVLLSGAVKLNKEYNPIWKQELEKNRRNFYGQL